MNNMKKLYTTFLMAMMASLSFAQEKNDTTVVKMDFNLNPWELPTSAMKKNPGTVDKDDETGATPLMNGYTFNWPVGDDTNEEIKLVLAPWDSDEYEYPSAYMGKGGHNFMNDSVMTYLCLRAGAAYSFVAPPSKYILKAEFYTYSMFGTGYGGIYHDETLGAHVWGKDSVQTYSHLGTEYTIWTGDSVKANFFSAGTTTLMNIVFYLLPRGEEVVEAIHEPENMPVTTKEVSLFDLQGRRVNFAKKGIYIVGNKKIVK